MWQTARMAREWDVLAPDGSEIRLLVQTRGGSLVHCTLGAGQVTQAVRHRTVEEVWLCLAGAGQLWRRSEDAQEIVDLQPGTAVSIPLRTEFQFRTTSASALEIVIATMPPWPGAGEAVPVDGHWTPTV